MIKMELEEMKIETVLFDLDGTILNTNELIIASFLHTLDYYFPNQYGREQVIPFIGPPLEMTFGQVTEDREMIEACIQRYRAHNLANHDATAKPFSYAKEVLLRLKENGMKIGIVTSKIRSMVLKGIRILELNPEIFDVIVTVEDITYPKPHPEPILYALEQLGACKERAMMVGDYVSDIVSGQAAGVKTAGVCWTWHGEESLCKLQPDYMLKDFRDILPIVGIESSDA